MISPGKTNMIDESVPAADATVCTMLFSWIVASRKLRKIAIEITAAGIDVAKVRPTLRPKKTLAAVNTIVMTTPRMTPRKVNSVRGSAPAVGLLLTTLPFNSKPEYRRHSRSGAYRGATTDPQRQSP